MKLVIEKNKKGLSFLPEVDAYLEYFGRHGVEVVVADRGEYDPSLFDAVLLFHGIHPFWRKYPDLIVGEYHSLSVGRYGRMKDFLKRLVNVRADVNIFLNENVRKFMLHSSSGGEIYRGMGYHGNYIPKDSEKIFDIVYTGSMREGVEDTLVRLADFGFKVVVAGNKEPIDHANIECFGRVSVAEAYQIMARARYGLNITPDIFPLNIQDSTKVIEYCAVGLGVITNKYEWVSKFEAERNGAFMDVSTILDKQDVYKFEFVIPDVSDLNWCSVMNSSGIAERLFSIKRKD